MVYGNKGMGKTTAAIAFCQSGSNRLYFSFKNIDADIAPVIFSEHLDTLPPSDSWDSFFENISSKDAAEILKRAETLVMPAVSTTALLQKTFGSSVKYTFSDPDRKRRPVYRDESLRGLYGWKKKFKEME